MVVDCSCSVEMNVLVTNPFFKTYFSVYWPKPGFCFPSLKVESGLSVSFSLVSNRNINKTF